MWPPLFHVVFGLCLLTGASEAPTALLLVALSAAWAAWRLYRFVCELAGPAAGLAASALFLTAPMVLAMTMHDARRHHRRNVAGSGVLARALRPFEFPSRCDLVRVFAALACLTKGNGVALVLMPLILMLITAGFDLLRRPHLYAAAAVVVVFAAPLLAISARFDASIGDFGPVTIARVATNRVLQPAPVAEFGTVSLAFACLGIWVVAKHARVRRDEKAPLAEALIALAGAAILFHLLNPHIVFVSRYMTMAIGPSPAWESSEQ